MSGDDLAMPSYDSFRNGVYQGELRPSRGLTKRELFAAMAMNAIRASGDEFHPSVSRTETVASLAVKYADALLAELAKERK